MNLALEGERAIVETFHITRRKKKLVFAYSSPLVIFVTFSSSHLRNRRGSASAATEPESREQKRFLRKTQDRSAVEGEQAWRGLKRDDSWLHSSVRVKTCHSWHRRQKGLVQRIYRFEIHTQKKGTKETKCPHVLLYERMLPIRHIAKGWGGLN